MAHRRGIIDHKVPHVMQQGFSPYKLFLAFSVCWLFVSLHDDFLHGALSIDIGHCTTENPSPLYA
jgi:hypothetical protein